MDSKLLIDVARLDRDGEDFEGELDCSVIDIDEELLKAFGTLRYDLFVQLLGSELLVRGSLSQDFDAVCSRCGGDFDFTVTVDDFVTSMEADDKTQFVDLTDALRECIILNLPTYPVCQQGCLGICPICGKNLNEGACSCSEETPSDCWAALDAVHVEEGTGK